MAHTYCYGLLVELEGNAVVPKLKNKLVKYFQSKKSRGGDCKVEYEDSSRTALLWFQTEEARLGVLSKEAHEIYLDQEVLKLNVRLPVSTSVEESAVNLNTTCHRDRKDNHQPSTKRKAESLTPLKGTIGSKKPAVADVVASESLHAHGDGQLPAAAEDPDAGNTDAPRAAEEEEEATSTSALLENVPESMNQEHLEMLVENILNSGTSGSKSPAAYQNFNLELIPGRLAVVTFQSAEETCNFISDCTTNKKFTKNLLSVRPLEVPTKMKVEDIPQQISSDHLLLYFERGGVVVEDVLHHQEEQSAIITFQDPKVVQKIIKKTHHIEGKPIKAFPFHESIGETLYGKDRPALKLPQALSENLDPAIWTYIKDKLEATETIQNKLAKHFCKVDLQQQPVLLSPLPSLLHQKGISSKDIERWKHNVKTVLSEALTTMKSLNLHVPTTAWEESLEEITMTLTREDVVMVPDQLRGVIAVAGPVDDVDRLEKPLQQILGRIDKKVHRVKSSVEARTKLSQPIYNILLLDGLKDEMTRDYPEMRMAYDRESKCVTVYGLANEVLGAQQKILDGVMSLKRKVIELDDSVHEFLQDEDQDEVTSFLLTSKGMDAVLEIDGKRVHLSALSEKTLVKVEVCLKNELISKNINVEDSSVLKMLAWQDLVNRLADAANTSFRKVMISYFQESQHVVVSGYRETVQATCEELDDFLYQNAEVKETITVNASTVTQFIKEHKKQVWQDKVRDKVTVIFKDEGIFLSGSRGSVTDNQALFENLVSSTFFDTLKISKPGAKKFFQDNETMYISSVKNQTGCVIQLVDREDPECFRSSRAPQAVCQLLTQDGVEIVVCKADMCTYSVDAVVNAANQTLNHHGGLAGALLKAAGSQLQQECEKLIQSRGHLKPGDCVLTAAGGRLACKHIIHAIGPNFDKANQQRVVGQLKRAVKGSLELAEGHHCQSVALPAISSNQCGFPPNLCAETIAQAVKEFCDDRFGENTIRKIHLVNNDDNIVQEMEAATKKQFGSHGTVSSQRIPQTVSAPRQQAIEIQTSSTSDRVRTKEGLTIALTKGNIQDTTSEVVVNTVGADLGLNGGPVSKAIFRTAGAELQVLINQQKSAGTVGEVIVTNGCNLRSKHVFHTISPHWDKGQGQAQKVLSGIVKECLNQAEQMHLASITFPAIGTGNLGFPKDIAASLMLDAVVQFSCDCKPNHLKEVVIVLYPGDHHTIQSFTDEYQKRFTSPSSSSVHPATSATKQKGAFSKITSISGMHETKMGTVAVQVVVGDITKETTDVIVNSTNEEFTLKSGVSKAIMEAAGPSVETMCQQLGAQKNNGMIMTEPGNLKCKKILHLVGQTEPKKIFDSVKKALIECAKNNYSSISIPAIGTGQGNVQASQVADAMLDAVVDVLGVKVPSTMRTVRIVIFQPGMLKDFHSSMQKIEDTVTQDNTLLGNIGQRMKSFFSMGSTNKPQKDETFVIKGQKLEPACFHICGNSQGEVNSAKQWLCDLIDKEQCSNCIRDNAILHLSKADLQRIRDLQKDLDVCVKLEQKPPNAVLTIEGLSRDVLAATKEINDMLRKAHDEEAFRKSVDVASALVEWQYQVQGGQFQSFDPVQNFHLEQALESKQKHLEVTVQGQQYKATLPDGPATDGQGTSLNIRRIDKITAQQADTLPQHWSPMPSNTSCQSFPILPGSAEYNKVDVLFKATCHNTIIKMERIQNPSMWQNFQIKKQDLETRNGHKKNERQLFHGTCHTTVNHINHHGFNRSYAGKNAAAYGNGTYFAINASYSASNTYSKPNAQGQKFMYLCRVLTGDYTRGHQGMIVPPAKGTVAIQLYDSVVDNPAAPTMFIVFHDCMAYPEYLITFQ